MNGTIRELEKFQKRDMKRLIRNVKHMRTFLMDARICTCGKEDKLRRYKNARKYFDWCIKTNTELFENNLEEVIREIEKLPDEEDDDNENDGEDT